jgi:T4 RnlA family RNA ligase
MYSVVKNFKIKNVFNKEDGSIASFVRLPNGKVLGKSKTSFESDQAISIQKIYDNDPYIKKFVDYCMDNDIVAVFEYVSPTNRIVLQYTNTQLILLRLRDNKTGKYLDIDDFTDRLDGISVTPSENTTLDELIELKSLAEDKEGWVLQFENGKMVKIKTDWYCDRHHLFTTDINRENTLIKMIIDETIDDVISQIGDESIRTRVDELTGIINAYIKKMSDDIDKLVSNYNGSNKDFAIAYSKDRLFPMAIGVINGKDKIELIKNRILSETKNLLM